MPPRFFHKQMSAKRMLDVALACVVLAFAGIPLLAIALATRALGLGPFLFRQVRVGQGGKLFTLYKIRTMTVGVDGSKIATEHDPRITSFGRILRSTKIDELPQLVNVIKGEMSLVGPRPDLPEFIDTYSLENRRVVLSVRPGLTDFASVRFRKEGRLLASQPDSQDYYNRVILPAKIRYYKFYVAKSSVSVDLYVMALTVWLLFTDLRASRRGAPEGRRVGAFLAFERRRAPRRNPEPRAIDQAASPLHQFDVGEPIAPACHEWSERDAQPSDRLN